MASSSKDAPTIVDNFVPPKDNFDHDLDEFIKDDSASGGEDETLKKWELERDLAKQQLDQSALDAKDYERAAMAQISTSRNRVKEPSNVVSLVCAWLVEHQIGECGARH